MDRVLAINRHTKNLAFTFQKTGVVFSDATVVVATQEWAEFVVLSSAFHEAWAWKHGSTMGAGTLRYTPSSIFETFPFPSIDSSARPTLDKVGERYHEHRRDLMRQLWLGLTDIYNLFHTRDLTPAVVAKVSKKSPEEAEAGYQGILDLRRLHRELDIAIRDAYGWADLDLGHDFHEIETLPENDRVRYTISPAARKEVLRRLLALNHQRAAVEGATAPVKKNRGKMLSRHEANEDLFDPAYKRQERHY
jgi:hypothetical protein